MADTLDEVAAWVARARPHRSFRARLGHWTGPVLRLEVRRGAARAHRAVLVRELEHCRGGWRDRVAYEIRAARRMSRAHRHA